MNKWGMAWLGAFVVLMPLAPARAADPVVYETWDAAYLDGHRAGYFHTRVQEVGKELHAHLTMNLSVRRFRDTASMRMESGTEETPDGKVVGVSMVQYLGKQQQMVLKGRLVGNQMVVKVEGQYQVERKIPWSDDVLGLYKQQRLFQERKVKPGDQLTYKSFEPTLNAIVTVRVQVKDEEETEVFQEKKKLLRVEVTPEKIMLPGGSSIQLPAMHMWLNAQREPLRSETQIPGLGKIVLYRATRAVALAPIAVPSSMTDVGLTQSIRLNRRLARPHDTDAVVYRITLKDDDDPSTAFAQDDRQEVKNVRDKSFELHVRAVKAPTMKGTEKAGAEFLQSNYFINCDDARVRMYAAQAVGDETDPWKKAQRIEKWVRQRMKVLNFTEAMATADHVARTLEGDCSEFSMLTAAMCRAVGVPSRTAVGLVYAELSQGPTLAYHMWTEVFAHGQWLAIDSTLGQGHIGAAHIKIADHSWHDTQSLVPMLPVMRVMMAKPAIEVLRVEGR